MRFSILRQDGTKLAPDRLLQNGWKDIVGSVGVHYFPDEACIRISNGVYDGEWAGGFYFGWIEIDGVKYGNGQEYFPAQGVLYIDVLGGATPGYAPAGRIGEVSVPFSREAAAMHRARKESPVTERLGLWSLAGVPQAAPPGVEWIEPVSGWQMDGAFHWKRHKAIMGRCALDCLSKTTGEPIKEPSRPRGYTSARGWDITTKLERFSAPDPTDAQGNRRVPKEINTGICPYRDRLLGLSRDNGWGPSDLQHLGNMTASAKALSLVGWKPAEFDLRVIAHDASYGLSSTPTSSNGQGSKFLGTRAPAWAMDTFLYDEHLRESFGRPLVGATCLSMTPAGQVMRVGKDDPEAQGFSPGLWTKSNGVQDPFAGNIQAGYSYELWLTGHALACYGEWRCVHRLVDGVFKSSRIPFRKSIAKAKGYIPKGLAVGLVGTSAALRTVDTGAGVSDYMPYIGPGELACEALHNGKSPTAFFDYALLISTPTQGKASNYRDLRSRLRNEWGGRSQVVCLLSALEQHLS